MAAIGENIKKARIKAGLTQKALAQKAHTAIGTIQQYEKGIRQPRITQLQNIAKALDLTIEDLVAVTSAEIRLPVDSGMVGTLDYYARKHNRTLNQELDTAVDQYLDSQVGMELLEENENESAEGNLENFDYYEAIFKYFTQLNEAGKQKAVERIEELTEIPKYQKQEEITQEVPAKKDS